MKNCLKSRLNEISDEVLETSYSIDNLIVIFSLLNEAIRIAQKDDELSDVLYHLKKTKRMYSNFKKTHYAKDNDMVGYFNALKFDFLDDLNYVYSY